jgi:putative membrane protein
LNSGISQSYEGAKTLNSGISDAASGAKSLVAGSSTVKSGTSQISSGVNQLINNSSTTVTNLAIVQGYLSDPNTTINDSSSPFNGMTKLQAANAIISNIVLQAQKPESQAQISSLRAGFTQLQSGINDLDTGAGSLSTALNDQILPGSTSLSQGLGQLSSGSNALGQGISSAYSGTKSLVNGLANVTSGSQSLDTGISSARTGAEQLGKELSTGAQEAIRKNNVSLTDKLSPMMSNPVVLDDESINKVANYGTGFSPYFIPLALWVGSLVLFLVIKVNKKKLTDIKPHEYFASKFITLAKIGTLQAVILDLVLIFALGLKPLSYITFFAFTILISWCFLAILELFVATLQDGGKFLGIVLLMLQLTSASGTYPVQTSPAFFQAINPYLPMTYAVKGLREIISGGNTHNIILAFMYLLIFVVVFLAILLLSSKRIMKSKINLAV